MTTLRPFRPEEAELVWAARTKSPSPTSRITPGARRALDRQIAHSGTFHQGFLRLAVDVEGRLVGEVDVRAPEGAFPPGVYEFGIELYESADRGSGRGAEAVRQLLEWLFTREGAERVQASTAPGNAAMRRVLEKLGFTEEGTLRGFMPTREGREDYLLYALTRADWDMRR
jgi:[ribosomal protein S5]-alanine N-acetyltransferase